MAQEGQGVVHDDLDCLRRESKHLASLLGSVHTQKKFFLPQNRIIQSSNSVASVISVFLRNQIKIV